MTRDNFRLMAYISIIIYVILFMLNILNQTSSLRVSFIKFPKIILTGTLLHWLFVSVVER